MWSTKSPTPNRPVKKAIPPFLVFSALVYLGFGVALLIAPAAILGNIDITLGSPSALSDARADYGGCAIGIGLFLAICAMRPEWRAAGLLCTAFSLAGFAGGRLLSLALDGMPQPLILILLAAEAGGAITAAVLYAKR